MINIIIIHYNANDSLIKCLESLKQITNPFTVHLFDNSDETPFIDVDRFNFIKYYDNTKGQLVDFTNKIGKLEFASYTHSKSVQFILDLIKTECLLLDSDVILKKDISTIMNNNYNVISGIENREQLKTRFLPHIMYLNLNEQFKFFDESRISPFDFRYDTCASLYEDIIKYGENKYKLIDPDDYVIHEKGASFNILAKREWSEMLLRWKSKNKIK